MHVHVVSEPAWESMRGLIKRVWDEQTRSQSRPAIRARMEVLPCAPKQARTEDA